MGRETLFGHESRRPEFAGCRDERGGTEVIISFGVHPAVQYQAGSYHEGAINASSEETGNGVIDHPR
jgi:hypothetical protein